MKDVPETPILNLDWQSRSLVPFEALHGNHVSISPFAADDSQEFLERLCDPAAAALWHYLPFEPFESAQHVTDLFGYLAESDGWIPYIFRSPDDGRVLGTATHMRIRPGAGSAEVGFVLYSPEMQRSAAATEAMYVLARHVFEVSGYRRYEWKCDNENAASKRAAARLGFVYEGVFRQDLVVKGRNRNTAWFSMLDREWSACAGAFEQWLAPGNFDACGLQKRALAEIRVGAKD